MSAKKQIRTPLISAALGGIGQALLAAVMLNGNTTFIWAGFIFGTIAGGLAGAFRRSIGVYR